MSNKKAYYFSHDANAHEDDKIIVLMTEYGTQGYGWWWLIVETLFNQENNALDMSKKTTIPLLYRVMWDCNIKDIPKFIDFLVEVELLKREGDKVYSQSLMSRVEKFDAIRDARRKAANARWDKHREKKVEDMPFQEEEMTPTSKGKTVLSNDQEWGVFKSELLGNKQYNILTTTQLDSQREMCLNWLASTGKRKKDYKAFFRNWIKKYIDDKGLHTTSGKQMIY